MPLSHWYNMKKLVDERSVELPVLQWSQSLTDLRNFVKNTCIFGIVFGTGNRYQIEHVLYTVSYNKHQSTKLSLISNYWSIFRFLTGTIGRTLEIKQYISPYATCITLYTGWDINLCKLACHVRCGNVLLKYELTYGKQQELLQKQVADFDSQFDKSS